MDIRTSDLTKQVHVCCVHGNVLVVAEEFPNYNNQGNY